MDAEIVDEDDRVSIRKPTVSRCLTKDANVAEAGQRVGWPMTFYTREQRDRAVQFAPRAPSEG